MAHGLAFGEIGLNLGANQGYLPQADRPHLLAGAKDLNKQALEGI